jgi:hypothetical protein
MVTGKEQKAIQWYDASKELPAEAIRMYFVAIDGQPAFAYYQPDGNGDWAFNKENVEFWADLFEVPRKSKI